MPPGFNHATHLDIMLQKTMGSLTVTTQSMDHQSCSPIYSPVASVGSSSPESNMNHGNGNDSDSMSEDIHHEYHQNPLEDLRSFTMTQGYSSFHNSSGILATANVERSGFLECHVCKYVAGTQDELRKHISDHFPFKCSFCDYVARTEGRLKHHESKFHSQTPPECWTGNRRQKTTGHDESASNGDSSPGSNRPRTTKCKMCNFVGATKLEYYDHLKSEHTDGNKLLYCNQCDFVTPYKHHLEYHLRNHYGSKPFKCNKCNYKCVNQSMLNSHQKSHSNVYQFRCANCSYATKYCHSLKTHLKKYKHTPGPVLNTDGTVNSNSIIDVHGRRRGPKPRRRKSQAGPSEVIQPPISTIAQNTPSTSHASNFPPVSTAQPILYHPNIFNNFSGTMFPMDTSNCVMFPPNHYINPYLSPYGRFPSNYAANENHYPQRNLHRFEPANNYAQETFTQLDQAQEHFDKLKQTEEIARESLTQEKDLLERCISPKEIKIEEVEELPTNLSVPKSPPIEENTVSCDPLDLSNKSPLGPTIEEAMSMEVRKDIPVKNRRKGKAFKLNHYMQEDEAVSPIALTTQNGLVAPSQRNISPPILPSTNPLEEPKPSEVSSEVYRCSYCDIIFGDSKMYAKHKAYHSPGDPFRCGLCKVDCNDRVTLFEHFTYVSHRKDNL